MHLPSLLRDVRRLRGMSVRAAAARCDVPRATWAAWEAGSTTPSAARLDEVLRAVGFDLRLTRTQSEPPGVEDVRRHLRASVTVRARRALGEQLPAVLSACRTAPRLLTGPAAVGVWVPHVMARGPLPLPAASARSSPDLVRIRLDDRPHFYVDVPPPAQLLLDGRAEQWPSLLTAHRLLTDGPRDLADRRLPPHRDPDERREGADLRHTLTWGARSSFPVSETDSRGWRLDAAATLDDLLERQGFPPRHPRRD